MTVTLAPVPLAEKADLKAAMNPYLTEHADRVDPGRAHGDPTDDPYFDLYWSEPSRRPYWILDDGQRAGFCLINAHAPSGQAIDHAVSEFHVAPGRRRSGLGLAAFRLALAAHPGQWELQVFRGNPEGFAFWPRALEAAGVSAWEKIETPDRVIHRFRTP